MLRLRSYSIELSLVAILLASIGFFAYLGYGLVASSGDARPFSGDKAFEYAKAQVDMGPRITGSRVNEELKEWFSQELRSNGWHVVIQPFTTNNQTEAVNLIARNRKEVDNRPAILIGAHFNTRNVADQDENLANRDKPYPGANGGASGPALLLELARRIKPQELNLRLCLAFFDGGDNAGLNGWEPAEGSSYFIDTIDDFEELKSCASPQAVIILDLVGADAPLSFEATSDQAISSSLRETADKLNYSNGFAAENGGTILGDQLPFARNGIPTAFILDPNYPYRHTMSDTLDKLDREAMERIGRTLQTWIEDVAALQ